MDVQHVPNIKVGVRGLFEMNEKELKEHFSEMLNERTKQFELHIQAIKTEMTQEFKALALALAKYERLMEAKHNEQNMFRKQIEDERAFFPSREYVDGVFNAIRELIGKHAERMDTEVTRIDTNISMLEKFNSNLTGKLSIIGGLIIFVTILINVLLKLTGSWK